MNMADGGIQVKVDDIEIMHFHLSLALSSYVLFPLRQSLTM